jgi:hypothetical protein
MRIRDFRRSSFCLDTVIAERCLQGLFRAPSARVARENVLAIVLFLTARFATGFVCEYPRYVSATNELTLSSARILSTIFRSREAWTLLFTLVRISFRSIFKAIAAVDINVLITSRLQDHLCAVFHF